ncbi:MAG: TIGR03905 family TSCPD domain-containing protein [Selenomonadaceae bacterium]|nr:TIGR03905 family TSCPD domain-containing protein [Selenomonadaceae bacterium]MBR1858690.1 TIGR03905 family TSCPD domain-containing protein [Selenomonadaceae bacterium]
MENFSYTPQRVCSKQIIFDIDKQHKLHNVKFVGGCPGNLLAIGKLVEGQDAQKIVDLLKGNDCGGRGTSCGDQLAVAIEGALKQSA